MKQMRLVLFSIALLVLLFGLTAIVAYAQVTPHAQAAQNSHVQASCSGNGCNGLNPQTLGCAAGAYTVQTAVFSNAFVELRYSPTCKVNWGRVWSRIGANFLSIRIQRIDGLTYTFSGGTFTYAWSAMVYAPVMKARACGGLQVIEGCTAYI
ncbi:MAG: DUF2690 domain-containing protein [Chloroflexi bacterium]|nr:MAG: DUF2690 domain-containing protein [Chloroflexota bacterium]